MGRAPCCDKAKVKRGPWSPDEDELLKTYIQQQNGVPGNWIALPGKAGLKRCGKSCRLRWLNYLRPDIKHGNFNEEEDRVIYSLYNQIGGRWSIIAGHLHGRTDNDVKNHWNTKLKKRLMNFSINREGNNSIYIPTDHDAFPQLMISNHPEEYHFIRSTLLYQLAPSKTPSLSQDHHMNFVPAPPGLNELSHFVSNAASSFSSPGVPSISSSTCMTAASDDKKYAADPWPNYKIEGEEDNGGELIHMMGGFGNPYSGLWLQDEKVGEADCDPTHNLGELFQEEIDIKPDPDFRGFDSRWHQSVLEKKNSL